jgi:hypothetical protein
MNRAPIIDIAGAPVARLVAVALVVVLAITPLQAADEGDDFIELRGADYVRYDAEQGVVRARGDVRFAYREVEVSSDDLEADLRADRALLSGNVTLHAQGQEFHGDTLLVHLDTREWEFTNVRTAISPGYFERGVRSPLYLGAREATGFEDRLQVRGAEFTTCDRPHPHYEITARRLRIWPGRKLIAEDAAVWLLGKHVMTLPRFVVPLREPQRQPFIPLVGESQLEGRYLKALVNYVRTDNSYGTAHLDLMSRRGLGAGVEHTEIYGAGRTNLYLYGAGGTTAGAQEWTARGADEHDLGGGLTLRANADIRNDSSYYQADSRVINSQVALDRQSGLSRSGLALDYSRTSGSFDFTRLSTSLRHDQRGPRYGLSLDSRYDRHSTVSGQGNDLELNNRLQLTDHQARMDLRLVVSKRLDLDRADYPGDNFYQVVDYLPELTLETDTYRLRAAPLGVPARLSLSVGNFSEHPTDLDAYRVYLGYEALPATVRLGPSTRVSAQGSLRQYLYGDRDHTAQYAYGGNARLEHDLSEHWQTHVGYTLLEPKGFTPFRFDYIGAYRSAAFDLTYNRGERRRAQVRTGYDARLSRWQDVIARVEAPLHRNLQLGLSGGYDPNRGEPRDLLARLRFGDHRTTLDLGARYQPGSGKVQRVTGTLDWVADPKWRLQVLTSWDGLQHKFVYGEVLLTRDLHCWQAVAYYSLQRNLFRLDFRIKAFDWGRPDFDVGRYGQHLDTSLGEWY